MRNTKMYQAIFNELQDYLPDDWEHLVVHLIYGEATCSFSFYIKQNGKYTKCYDLPEVSEKALMSSFQKVDTIVSAERNQMEQAWSSMTMSVTGEGIMHTDFDYSTGDTFSFLQNSAWKKKYLI